MVQYIIFASLKSYRTLYGIFNATGLWERIIYERHSVSYHDLVYLEI